MKCFEEIEEALGRNKITRQEAEEWLWHFDEEAMEEGPLDIREIIATVPVKDWYRYFNGELPRKSSLSPQRWEQIEAILIKEDIHPAELENWLDPSKMWRDC